MRIRSLAVLFALVLPVEGQAPKKSAPPKAAPAAQPTLKAIWEPVNFPKDIDLYDIDCPAPEECWAVGDRSTIIHTTDGGKNWTAQLGGDTGATDPKMEELFFLDTKYGWASRADDKLFQTTDGGASWTEAGRQPLGGRRYNFVSPQTGYAVHWNEHELLRTDDGGKSWKQHAECKVSFQQRGLARETRCSFRDMDFSTPSNGYVTGLVPDAGGRGIVGTTKDGGATWLFSSPDVLDEVAEKGFFWGANGGIVGLTNNKNLLTTDGGATWTPIISPVAAWESVSGSPGGS
ncbi:MAG TPA: YCF48-related protein, partial [Bryobacteraceae bacterium]